MVVGIDPRVGKEDRRARLGKTIVGEVAETLFVDGVVQGVAKAPVAQHRIAQRARLVVGVEFQVVKSVVGVGDRLDALDRLQLLELRYRDAPGPVELALGEVAHHGVGVLVGLEVDRGDGRHLAIIVWVSHHLDVAALDVAHRLERTAADDRRFVAVTRYGRRG